MLSLVLVGLILLPARRKGKERASMVSVAFYGARGGVPMQNSIGHSPMDEMYHLKTPTAKTIPTLNNGLKFFLLHNNTCNKIFQNISVLILFVKYS